MSHISDKSGESSPIRGSIFTIRSRTGHIPERDERPNMSRREEKRLERGVVITEDNGRGGQESHRVLSNSSGSGTAVANKEDGDRPPLVKLSIPPSTAVVASRKPGSSQQGSASPVPGSAIPNSSVENVHPPTGPRSFTNPSQTARAPANEREGGLKRLVRVLSFQLRGLTLTFYISIFL